MVINPKMRIGRIERGHIMPEINETYEGITIETKVNRITQSKEPMQNVKPMPTLKQKRMQKKPKLLPLKKLNKKLLRKKQKLKKSLIQLKQLLKIRLPELGKSL